jgi:hypothetical protein
MIPVTPSQFAKVLFEKNKALMEAQAFGESESLSKGERHRLWKRAALLEDKLATALLRKGDQDRAIVNLISAASCFTKAGLIDVALTKYDEAVALGFKDTSKPPLREWITQQKEWRPSFDREPPRR